MPSTPDASRRPQPSVPDDQGSGHSRRSLLRAGMAGGGAAALLAAGGLGPAGGAARAAQSATPTTLQTLFPQAPVLDFETLFAFGSIGYGCAEFGELVRAVNQINEAGASFQTYCDTFLALGYRTRATADAELATGRLASARSAYLRAASYYDMGLYFILGSTGRAKEPDVYAAMQACWQAASQLFDPPFEAVRIPYRGSWMPGYLLKPDDRPVRRPTLILNNGEDAQHVALYANGGAAAIERGYNALLFYGPGQGSMLFERQIPFRPDWEKVITPVVDYLLTRPDVDPARIALVGSSLGGELVARAAAFEPRLAALVADPGFLSVWLSWQTKLRQITRLFAHGASKQQVNSTWQKEIVPQLNATDRYTLAKTSEGYGRQFLLAARAGRVFSDLYDLGTTLMKFSCEGVVDRITAPTLVTAYQGDSLVVPAVKQGSVVYQRLRCTKQFHDFTAAQGAEYHCAPMDPQTRNQVVYDWLDATL